jgi:hypothetical protein
MTSIRTAMIATAVAAAMAGSASFGSAALAADGALAPGKPAGVRQAARSTNLLLIGGAALVAVAGIAIAVSQGNDAQCGTACSAPATTT